MTRATTASPMRPKPLSLWGLLLGLPTALALSLFSTGQGTGTGDAPPPNPPPPPVPPVAPPSAAAPPAEGSLTQAQFDAAWARKRDAEADTARSALLKTLGYESLEDAQAAADARKAENEKNLSDAQKATKRADEATAAAQAETAKAQKATRRAQVTLALAAAAVRTDRITQAATLLLADLPDDADEAAVVAAVTAQTTSMPEFYGSAEGGVDIAGRGRGGGAPPLSEMAAGTKRATDARTAAAANGSAPDPFAFSTPIGR